MPPVCLLLMLVCLRFFGQGYSHSYDRLQELNTEFAIKLYRTLVELENRTNLVVSPSSVANALGLLQFGARGSTFTQIASVLGYSVQDESVLTFMKSMHRELMNSSQHTSMHLACALFIQTGTPLSAQFIKHAAGWANSSLQHTDFSQHNQMASQMSQWIARNTGGGLQMLVPCGAVGPGFTPIALASTMYFRSKWKTKFSFTDTQMLPFIAIDGSVIKVPMMHQTADINYGQFETPSSKKFSVVELPYLESTVSMLVVRPTEKNLPLSSIEAILSAKAIALWTSSMKRFKMDVFLPRFKLQSHSDLRTILPAMGALDLFETRKADFKGISGTARCATRTTYKQCLVQLCDSSVFFQGIQGHPMMLIYCRTLAYFISLSQENCLVDGSWEGNLYVSQAIHKAEIEVAEGGTRASGVTAMVLLKRSRMPVFKADRPFIFILRQASSGSVLFIGRVINPLH